MLIGITLYMQALCRIIARCLCFYGKICFLGLGQPVSSICSCGVTENMGAGALQGNQGEPQSSIIGFAVFSCVIVNAN